MLFYTEDMEPSAIFLLKIALLQRLVFMFAISPIEPLDIAPWGNFLDGFK